MSAAAALADVDEALGVAAPLPRSNGELVFEEVWQGRALGLGVVVLDAQARHGASSVTILWRRSRHTSQRLASRPRLLTTPPGSTRSRRCPQRAA